MRRVFMLLLLMLVLMGAWLFRGRLSDAWRDWRNGETQVDVPTEALADSAQRKLDALLAGSSTSVALTALELQSLLNYRYQGIFPAFLGAPAVELADDQVRLRARVPVDKLPPVKGLDEVIALLPDTTDLTVAGKLLPLENGRVAFGIDEVTAASIPLPRRLIPPMLERIGRTDEAGLPNDAIAFRLPRGVSAAYVRADSLHLLAAAAQRSTPDSLPPTY